MFGRARLLPSFQSEAAELGILGAAQPTTGNRTMAKHNGTLRLVFAQGGDSKPVASSADKFPREKGASKASKPRYFMTNRNPAVKMERNKYDKAA